jgi:hypothetical protein
MSSLESGGDICAEMLSGALDHALDVLEQLSASTPRKARRSMRDVSDRVEAVLESVDVEWCDGVSRCDHDELDRLSGLVVCVRGLSPTSAMSEASGAVTDMLDCLDRCGSVVLQSVSALLGSGSDGAMRVSALETLRGLSEARLECVSADESAAFAVVKRHLSVLEACVGDEVVSSCMAMYTLGCRNGLGVCGTVEVAELAGSLTVSWLKHASGGGDDDFAAGASLGALWVLNGVECAGKIPSESRGAVEKAFVKGEGMPAPKNS